LYHVFDGAPHFFTDQGMGRFALPQYAPTFEDVLYCRRKTVGILEAEFKRDELVYHFQDVGGQRSERKKWKQSFGNTDALIFIISVSEFDQLCYEDNETNRMIESLELFESTINSVEFLNKPIFVFFNVCFHFIG
jgi:guanine nucleotide-binding protein G(i) subunit alpha